MLAPLLVSRLKVMAKLDIAEKRIPQDGRISVRIAGHAIDIRMSTNPTAHGERIVLRLLDKQAGQLELEQLHMNEAILAGYKKLLAGILAAKKTGELIPLCHPLPLTHCAVDFEIPPARDRIRITASARLTAGTGVGGWSQRGLRADKSAG